MVRGGVRLLMGNRGWRDEEKLSIADLAFVAMPLILP